MQFKSKAIALFLAVAFLAGCASKPPVVDEPAASTVSDEDIAALHAEVLAARNDAFDLGAKDQFPTEYDAAEATYTAGKTSMDAKDNDAAKASFETVLPVYRDLASRSAQAAAEKTRGDADAARQVAVANGAETQAPAALSAGDQYMAQAAAAYEAGNHREAFELYRKALYSFDAAEKKSSAAAVRDKVDAKDFGKLDSGNYALAGEQLAAVDGLLAEDPEGSSDAAEEALLRYNIVWKTGWEISATSGRDAAGEYKVEAEAIKAEVAVKDDYDAALAVWNEAMVYYAAGDYENALPLLERAKGMFKAVYETAAAKRAAAEAAINAAAASTDQAGELAEEGDAILGTETDGDAGTEAGASGDE